MSLEHKKPFKDPTGEVVTMKSVITISDSKTKQVISETIQVYENKNNYTTDQLTAISPEEYNHYLSQFTEEMEEEV